MLADLATRCRIGKMNSQHFSMDRRHQTRHPRVCKSEQSCSPGFEIL
jgi:hypothetical protein